MTKLAKARQVARELMQTASFKLIPGPEDLLSEAYLRGRADEREHCKDIAREVRKALDVRGN
jgi:methionine synthase II (cobalamin-independent)